MYCEAWFFIGRFVAFCPKGRGFESRPSHIVGSLGSWASPSLAVAVTLRRETPTIDSIRAASGAPLSSSGLEEAL